jgi:hypothetical protein
MTDEERAKELLNQLVDQFDSILMNEISDEFARKYTSRDCARVAINLVLDTLTVKISPPRLDIHLQINKYNFNKLKQTLIDL